MVFLREVVFCLLVFLAVGVFFADFFVGWWFGVLAFLLVCVVVFVWRFLSREQVVLL